MSIQTSVADFLDEVAAPSPAPGGGSVAALAGALGVALTSMVCNLTIGKKRYADVEGDMKRMLQTLEALRATFTSLIEKDTVAFRKVMEAYALPRESEGQKTLRSAAIQEATKEATLVPLEVMKHCIDALALSVEVAEKGNVSSVSDAGVGALMLRAACEGAALNVRINLPVIADMDFVGWRSDEMESLLKTSKTLEENTQAVVARKIRGG